MDPDDVELIDAQIDRGLELVAAGAEASGVQAFALARSMVAELCDQDKLDRRLRNHENVLTLEREEYRALLAGRRTAAGRLLVVADSLGLPRPEDKTGDLQGVDRTYPWMLMEHLRDHGIQSYCQRYFTTQDVVDLLESDADIGAESDVVIHVGLNDCANRMFLERERIALNLVPDGTKEKIVGFAQKHRRLVIEHLPSYHYVPPHAFRTNLELVMGLLRQRRARRIVLATIILPPERFWPATPGLRRNFANYNLMIMDAAERFGGELLDIDRHVWGRQHEGVLLPDGMHLSESGHQLFADQAAALLA